MGVGNVGHPLEGGQPGLHVGGHPAGVDGGDPHAHAIAVQHGAHFLRGEVDHGLAVIAAHESVPILMTFDLPFDFAEQSGSRKRRG